MTAGLRDTAKTQRPLTALAKYVFLDVVHFSQGRSVEAQTDIVASLNEIVRTALRTSRVGDDNLLLIPTGDGTCIAILGESAAFDVHVRIALDILAQVDQHNSKTRDEMRRFKVRIGINENVDNLVTDINDRKNVAGAGISMARRIMELADGDQILVGHTVFDTLSQREKYMSAFKQFSVTVKHGVRLDVYQFVADGLPCLNIDRPVSCSERSERSEPGMPKLTQLCAYYLAHLMRHRDFLVEMEIADRIRASVLFYFLSRDAEGRTLTPKYQKYDPKTLDPDKSVEQQLKKYSELPYIVLLEFNNLMRERFADYGNCFLEEDLWRTFVSEEGMTKLKNEWPDIWNEFELDKYT